MNSTQLTLEAPVNISRPRGHGLGTVGTILGRYAWNCGSSVALRPSRANGTLPARQKRCASLSPAEPADPATRGRARCRAGRARDPAGAPHRGRSGTRCSHSTASVSCSRPRFTRCAKMQTALGLVAAETGICLVPTSVERFRRDNVESRPLDEEKAIMRFWRILGRLNSQNRAFTPWNGTKKLRASAQNTPLSVGRAVLGCGGGLRASWRMRAVRLGDDGRARRRRATRYAS
jgi:hypothetical protein